MALMFNIDVCGPPKCGKSAFIERCMYNRFTEKGARITEASFMLETQYGKITVNMSEGEHDNADGRIVLFRLDKKIPITLDRMMHIRESKIVCGTFSDLYSGDVSDIAMQVRRYDSAVPFYRVSSKYGHNVHIALRNLIRVMTGLMI